MKERRVVNFNQDWKFSKKEGDWCSVTLPHTWNAEDGQDGGNDYYRGTCWYEKDFQMTLDTEEEVWLEFEAVAMSAKVFLNGKKMAEHEGGYSTFRINLTEELIDGVNHLEVSADNSKNDRVYPQKADFTFYGGIYRNVNLVIVPKEHFALGNAGDTGIQITAAIASTIETESDSKVWGVRLREDIPDDVAAVSVKAKIEHGTKDSTVEFELDGQKQIADVDEYGYAETVFFLKHPHLWNGKTDPYLYDVTAKLQSGDSIQVQYGIRFFQIDPEKGFILNGKSYPLCGAARHQDKKGIGYALTREDHDLDMNLMLEMGINTVRLAHYQHDQYFYQLCDEKGLLVWAEIPYISEHMESANRNAISQMQELILQNQLHPSIMCWGLSNEITASGGSSDEIYRMHEKLNSLCHKLDVTRPTTMAHVFMLDIEDPLVTLPDIRSYNLYYGWYVAQKEQNDSWFDQYHQAHPDVAMGLSEYGADANPAYHSSHPEKGDWTEEYQLLYHAHMLKMWKERPFIWAMHCWNMFDFGADGRDEGGKPGQNQKGLITFDRKVKKDAFYIYKAYLSDQPFVHICGKGYEDRTGDHTDVRVVTNQKKITWYLDGIKMETLMVDKMVTLNVPMSGSHLVSVEVVNDDLNRIYDEVQLQKVNTENPSYRKAGGDVVNWFDRDDEMIKEGYFSIKDSLNDIKGNKRAYAVYNEILGPTMRKAEEAYGEVAKNITFSEEIQRQMDAMNAEEKLKQISSLVTPELVHKLNYALNQIEKKQEEK